MKFLIYTLMSLTVLLIISQIWSQNQTNGIEMYPYTVLQEFDEFETRKYEKANFAYVTMDAENYKEGSNKGFRQLAGYIFGGNDANKQIAMTSPVEMIMDDKMTMKFMVPSKYNLDELPKPDNTEVKFEVEPEKVMAAIRFGGFANDKKIVNYKSQLFDLLDKNEIPHKDQWSFLGYNPPYDLINRRNEIVVELEDDERI
jgi:hypothetical protein